VQVKPLLGCSNRHSKEFILIKKHNYYWFFLIRIWQWISVTMNETRKHRFGVAFMPADADCTMFPGSDNIDRYEKLYLKKARSWAAPDVVQLTGPDGVKFVMKDWSERPLPFRETWCRVAAKREIRVYEKLRGMAGVPQLICNIGNYGFIMEWLDARPLPRTKMRDLLGLEFFTHLDDIVAEMHKRGVAHGDLRRRNILRGLDGLPKLIDFETAVHSGSGEGGGRMFRAMCNVDRITVVKIRARYFPESITDADRELLDDVPWHLAAGRYVRREIYGRLTKKGRRRRSKKLAKLK
jgi:hypothetical protein